MSNIRRSTCIQYMQCYKTTRLKTDTDGFYPTIRVYVCTLIEHNACGVFPDGVLSHSGTSVRTKGTFLAFLAQ